MTPDDERNEAFAADLRENLGIMVDPERVHAWRVAKARAETDALEVRTKAKAEHEALEEQAREVRARARAEHEALESEARARVQADLLEKDAIALAKWRARAELEQGAFEAKARARVEEKERAAVDATAQAETYAAVFELALAGDYSAIEKLTREDQIEVHRVYTHRAARRR